MAKIDDKTSVPLFNVLAAVFAVMVSAAPGLLWVGNVDAKTVAIEQRLDKQREAIIKNNDNDVILLDRTARMETKIDILIQDMNRRNHTQ